MSLKLLSNARLVRAKRLFYTLTPTILLFLEHWSFYNNDRYFTDGSDSTFYT